MAILWPNDKKYSTDLLPLTNFFVKSLPIQDDYFEELNENIPDSGINYENINDLPIIEVYKMFNEQNNRVLFTMFSVGCMFNQDNFFVGNQPILEDLPQFMASNIFTAE